MVLCPIALAASCEKCPAFKVCPLKGVIGDYKEPDPDQTAVPPPEQTPKS
jgi:hypothetical protein